jgi:hypothetical protein
MEPDVTAALAIIGVVVSVGGSLLAVINHTRVRSVCCGNKLEVSLDVEKTSPVERQIERQKSLKIKVPADSKV